MGKRSAARRSDTHAPTVAPDPWTVGGRLSGRQRLLDAARYGRGQRRRQAWAVLLLPVAILIVAVVVWAIAVLV